MAQANIVLAAITDLLKERGLDSTQSIVNPTHYFGTLMVLLEQRDTHPVETIGAILYLLSVLLPQLSKGVLKAKSEPVSDILISVLDKHASDATITKHILQCAATLLGALSDTISAHGSRLLQVLLVYSLDHRPRIRRAGQEGVRDTLKQIVEHQQNGTFNTASIANTAAAASSSSSSKLPKPINDTIQQFCIREIAQSTPKDCQVVLFLCGLLQSTIQFLSISASGKILEALLSMVAKGNSILFVQTMRTCDAFFLEEDIHELDDHPSPDALKQREKYLKMSGQLLSVLLNLKPHHNDQLASTAYLHTLKTGLVHFTAVLEKTSSNNTLVSNEILRDAYARVPDLLTLIGDGILSPKKEVAKSSASAMSDILKHVVGPKFIAASVAAAEAHASGMSASGVPPFYRVIEYLESLLGYRFKAEWNRCLPLVGLIFLAVRNASPQVQSLTLPLLKKLDLLRNESLNEVFTEDPTRDYRANLDEAIGAAIEGLGPEYVLTALPLNLPTDYYRQQQPTKKGAAPPTQQVNLSEQLNQSRSWLLPLFRSYVSASSMTLGFFLDFFVPIASELHGLEKIANQKSKPLEAKVFSSLKIAVWDIFPSVCAILPKDIGSVYKNMVRTLVEGYLNQDEMQWTHERICKGLGAIIRRLKDCVEVKTAKSTKSSSASSGASDSAIPDDSAEADADAVFDDDDEEDDDADDDDDDHAALARARVKHAVKKAQKQNARQAKEEKEAELDGTDHDATHSKDKYAHYTAKEAQELLTHVVAPLSKHLLPVLFNLAAMPMSNKPAVFECVVQSASIAESGLLNSTFKTVLRKLLEHSVSAKNRRIAAKESSEQAMNDDVAASKTPNNQAAQDLQRSHLLTDIVYALCVQSVASLSTENIAYLYGILKNHLLAVDDDSYDGPLQKKLYKVLAALMEQESFFTERWKELVQDLSEASVTLQPAALKARIQCIRIVLLHLPALMLKDKAALAVLPSFLGELILASKEPAARTRDAALDSLIELGRKMVEVQDARLASNFGVAQKDLFGGLQHAESQQPMLAEYVYMLAGGLAGSSAHMQSAAVLCLARVLYEFKAILNPQIVTSLLHTVLPFFESKSRELIKSLLAFIKVCLLTFPLDILEREAPAIVNGLVLWSSEKKQRFKLKIKLLFEIMMKKIGSDTVREMVPPQHTALLDHIRKTKEREKRQKAEAWQAKKGNKEKDEDAPHKTLQDYDSIMQAEADVDMADDSSKGGVRRKGMSAKDANAVWLRDSEVDFLDSSVVTKVSSTNPLADQPRRATGFGNGVTQDASTGKIRIEGEENNAASSAQSRAAAMIDIDELDSDIKNKQREKRKRRMDEDEDDEEGQSTKRQQLPGSQFRSTKAGGDMKRKGGVQPYAFVALDPAAMNKRKKITSQRRLESIVRAAKHGSQTGSTIAKSHSRSHKNKTHKKHN